MIDTLLRIAQEQVDPILGVAYTLLIEREKEEHAFFTRLQQECGYYSDCTQYLEAVESKLPTDDFSRWSQALICCPRFGAYAVEGLSAGFNECLDETQNYVTFIHFLLQQIKKLQNQQPIEALNNLKKLSELDNREAKAVLKELYEAGVYDLDNNKEREANPVEAEIKSYQTIVADLKDKQPLNAQLMLMYWLNKRAKNDSLEMMSI